MLPTELYQPFRQFGTIQIHRFYPTTSATPPQPNGQAYLSLQKNKAHCSDFASIIVNWTPYPSKIATGYSSKQVPRLVWRSAKLTKRLQRCRFYHLSLPTPACTDVVWSRKHVGYLPKSNGRYHVLCLVAVGSRLRRRYNQFFENCRAIFQPPLTSTV